MGTESKIKHLPGLPHSSIARDIPASEASMKNVGQDKIDKKTLRRGTEEEI
jgi:hypothetical protein